jgi:tRNA (cmo5U34)-methyltransferase
VSAQFHWNPETYREQILAEVPRFEELQAETIRAIPFPPRRVLELGVGTGETSRALLQSYPEAEITGLDSSPEMVFHAREAGIDVGLARMEDPLPDGPWDLVVAVLSVHHLPAEGKRDLFRRVREQARALVVGDVVVPREGGQRVTPIDPDWDYPERVEDLLDWSGAELRWQQDDLAVIAASYE